MSDSPSVFRASRAPVILGTSSVWRQKVLRDAGIPFTAMSPGIDEKIIRHRDPSTMTLNIALAKAAALLPKIDGPALLVTSDQVATFRGEVREKPADADEAARWLREYRNAEVGTVTAVLVTDVATRRTRHVVDVCSAAFGDISDAAVDAAVAGETVLGSCGAFAIDEPNLAPFVLRVRGFGDENEVRTSIDGLPIGRTLRLLRSFGWTP